MRTGLIITLFLLMVPSMQALPPHGNVADFTTVDELLAAPAGGLTTTYAVKGLHAANDGNGGLFYYDPASAVPADGLGSFVWGTGRLLRMVTPGNNLSPPITRVDNATISVPSARITTGFTVTGVSSNWMNQLDVNGVWLDIRNMGASTNSLDNSAAYQQAVTYLGSVGGGTIRFPTGRFAGHLLINKPNITVIGSGGSKYGVGTELVAVTNSVPILQLGDNTGHCDYSGVQNLRVNGLGTAAEGIRLHGGAEKGVYIGVYATGCTNYDWHIEPGTIYAVELNTFVGCGLTLNYNGAGANVAGLYIKQASNYPTSFLTSQLFVGGHYENGGCTNGDTILVDGCVVTWQAYGDLGSTGHGVRFANTGGIVHPVIDMVGGTLDAGGGTNVAVHVYDSSVDILQYFSGHGQVAGSMVNNASTLTPLYGSDWGVYQSFASYPFITGSLNLQDPFAANAWAWNNDNRLYGDHGNAVLVGLTNINLAPTNPNGVVQVTSGLGLQAPQSSFGQSSLGVVAPSYTTYINPTDGTHTPLHVRNWTSGGVTGLKNIQEWEDPNGLSSVVNPDASLAPHELVYQGTFGTAKVMLNCNSVFTLSSGSVSPFNWQPAWQPSADNANNFYSHFDTPQFKGSAKGGYMVGQYMVPISHSTSTLQGMEAFNISLDSDNGGVVTNGVMLNLQNPPHAGVFKTVTGLSFDVLTSGTVNKAINNPNSYNYFGGLNIGTDADPGANTLNVSGEITASRIALNGAADPGAGGVSASQWTASTLPQVDGTKRLVSIANAAGALINDGAGAFTYQTGITQTSVIQDHGSTNWTFVITKGLITSLTHSP